MKIILALFFTLILSHLAHANSRIERVVGSLNTTLQCTNRIWPGLKKENYRVLFTQPSTNESWLWHGRTGKSEKINRSEFSTTSKIPRYAFSEFRGEKTVIINLDEVNEKSTIPSLRVDGAVGLALHEGFHYLFQMKEPWVAEFSTADRKTDFDRVTALYLRRMLIRSLKAELLAGKGFGHSAFWFQKWKALGEAPETKLSDTIEGTANYIEIIASIIADQGCQISEKNLMQIAKSNLSSVVDKPMTAAVMKELFKKYVETGYQIEGYEIGLLSLLALRGRGVIVGENEYQMGRDFVAELQKATSNTEKIKVMTELQSAVAKVQTPAEILLHDVLPVEDQDDFELQEVIKKSVSSEAKGAWGQSCPIS